MRAAHAHRIAILVAHKLGIDINNTVRNIRRSALRGPGPTGIRRQRGRRRGKGLIEVNRHRYLRRAGSLHTVVSATGHNQNADQKQEEQRAAFEEEAGLTSK